MSITIYIYERDIHVLAVKGETLVSSWYHSATYR